MFLGIIHAKVKKLFCSKFKCVAPYQLCNLFEKKIFNLKVFNKT